MGRAISGIAQEKSVGLAIRVLRLITRMGHYSYSPLTVARVHSLVARAHYEKLSVSPPEMDAIIKDETAELDPALQVGGDATRWPRTTFPPPRQGSTRHSREGHLSRQRKRQARSRLPGHSTHRHDHARSRAWFAPQRPFDVPQCAPLWRAIDERLAEVAAEEEARQRKVDKRPNEYVCAGPGCTVGAVQRGALRACSGSCPKDLKPSYCGKECQLKVRLL